MANQILKDRSGIKIGEIKMESGNQRLYNRSGQGVGLYNTQQNKTYDRSGRCVGTGNILMTLL